MSENSGREIIRIPEVSRLLGNRSRTQIWRDVRAGRLPAPVQIGPNAIGFYRDEIEAIQATLPRVNYAPAAALAAVQPLTPA